MPYGSTRFQRKFFVAAMATAVIALAVAGTLVATTMRRQLDERIESTLVAQARLAADLLARAAPLASTDELDAERGWLTQPAGLWDAAWGGQLSVWHGGPNYWRTIFTAGYATVPEDVQQARMRDPNTKFVSYVPPGTLARGKVLVETGDNKRTVACGTCHGPGLVGLKEIGKTGIASPRIAGAHPIYLARQLYLFKDGTRNGVDAQLMKKPVARLTDEDILAIAAYLGSL